MGFWIGLMLVYGSKYQMLPRQIIYFFGIILLSYLAIDALKIVGAKKLRAKMTPARIYRLKKILGLILIGFGLVLFLKSYIPKESMNKMEKKLEKPLKRFERN